MILAAFGLLIGGSGVAEAKKKPICARKGSKTTVDTSRVRVFLRGDAYYGCLKAVGKSRYLVNQGDGVYENVGSFLVAGRYVSHFSSYVPECKADCPPGVTGGSNLTSVDLRTGREKYGVSNPVADGYVLATNGAMAWISSAPSTTSGEAQVDVLAIDADGQRTVSSFRVASGAADAAVKSLKVNGKTVSWLDKGETKTAELS